MAHLRPRTGRARIPFSRRLIGGGGKTGKTGIPANSRFGKFRGFSGKPPFVRCAGGMFWRTYDTRRNIRTYRGGS